MTSSAQVSSLLIGFVKKAVTYQSGAFTVISIGTVSLAKIVEALFLDITLRDAILPLVIDGVLMILFAFIALYDFWTGTRAAKIAHIKGTGSKKGYTKSDLLWSTIWKGQAVVIINTFLFVFCYLFLFAGIDWLYQAFLFGIFAFFFVVICFEIHSIGENQEERFGKKPPFYDFIDKVSEAVREGLIDKVRNLFKSK